MATSEPLPFVYPPLAAVDAAAQLCQFLHDGLHETLLLPAEPSDRFVGSKLRYYQSALSTQNLDELLVPTLRHLAVAVGLCSRLYVSYPLPHHALQRLFSLMSERVLSNRHRDATWPQRNPDHHVEDACRHLDRLFPLLAQPAATLNALDCARIDAADAANYLAFARFLKAQTDIPVLIPLGVSSSP